MKGRETLVVEDIASLLGGCLDCLVKFKDKNIFKRIVRSVLIVLRGLHTGFF